jgi:hypothetical protein
MKEPTAEEYISKNTKYGNHSVVSVSHALEALEILRREHKKEIDVYARLFKEIRGRFSKSDERAFEHMSEPLATIMRESKPIIDKFLATKGGTDI